MLSSVTRVIAFCLLLSSVGRAARAQDTASAPPSWISVDSAARTVTLALEVNPGTDQGSATIAGFQRGGIQIVVPLGWTVKWNWLNADSIASHSLVLMAEREKLPAEGGRPPLDNALSRNVTTGLKPGQKDQTTFLADQAGWYWLLCGVPGHALAGEWIGLKIDPEIKVPRVVEKQ